MKKTQMLITLILICIALVFTGCNLEKLGITPDKKDGYVEDLDAVITPLDGSSPSLAQGDLGVLDFLGNARIVGLGAGSYGTREFAQTKHRIFQYLVEHHGFRVLLMECDFAESVYFDRYITTGEGNLDELMRTRLSHWLWRTGEFKILLEWMREYNVGRAEADMLRCLGFDCRYLTYNAELLSNYLENVSPELLAEFQPLLTLTGDLEPSYFREKSKAEYEAVQDYYREMYDRITANADAFVPVEGRDAFEKARRLVWSILQYNEIAYKTNFSGATVTCYEFQAQNALWAVDVMGENEKAVVWAHNHHVARHWLNQVYGSMGYHLGNELGGAYKNVGFTFSFGTFHESGGDGEDYRLEPELLTLNSVIEEKSFNYLFNRARYSDFIFRPSVLRSDTGLSEWLESKHPFLTVGATYVGMRNKFYNRINLPEEYDTIVYFDEVTEADMIQR